ncbi:GNAT family N-acetyltransferase [Herpetosiphon giganteus]|uniref:GNAT family N-acetyltransferase n=1 Tax=Herpetosiphon giganteus TaxID=2029754 RepID=UPI00195BD293|nr:GNAT family N-acetyltransferase [Herpetosiphon giganteus]MBM7844133.1 aminoglycoside 2'-N-acetyltransferase I [Herpetosiphon giganteus]
MAAELSLQICKSADLTPDVGQAILAMCSLAYDEDFAPYLNYANPVHVLGWLGSELVSHAMWVERWLQIGDEAPRRTAYIEAVATHPDYQKRGYASHVLRHLVTAIDDFALAALSPSDAAFYQRLGWELWRGPLAMRTEQGVEPTPDEEVMILRLPKTGPLDLAAPISVEWREGEVW